MKHLRKFAVVRNLWFSSLKYVLGTEVDLNHVDYFSALIDAFLYVCIGHERQLSGLIFSVYARVTFRFSDATAPHIGHSAGGPLFVLYRVVTYVTHVRWFWDP